ncbi:hypothetical protein NDU88_001771 [Pleurodeles waltl]|uniref:Uncharacterized protein n=1 Tax=Pleurodeles waltl TaxID=8319 RepID=A0AAV7KSC1_PLEWA|nr:hypothetical protein NDU88_001771 [Pleurodeles waltl]
MSECVPLPNAPVDVSALRVQWLVDPPWDCPDSGPCRVRGGSVTRFESGIHPAPWTLRWWSAPGAGIFHGALREDRCFLRVSRAMSAKRRKTPTQEEEKRLLTQEEKKSPTLKKEKREADPGGEEDNAETGGKRKRGPKGGTSDGEGEYQRTERD